MWRASSRSGTGNCVQAASRCQTSECVEVAHGPAVVWVRDSQDPAGPHLVVTPAAWAAFTTRLKAR